MEDKHKRKDELIRELQELRRCVAELESHTPGEDSEGLSLDAADLAGNSQSTEEVALTSSSLPDGEPTATIDLSSLFTKELTDSGSFDVRSDIWATTFGRLLQALPIPAILIDQSGNVFQANQACGRVMSDAEAILGMGFDSLFADQDASRRAGALLEKVFQDRRPRLGETWLDMNGVTIWARMTFRSIRIFSERFVLILIEDLTAEKQRFLLKQRHEEELEKEIERRNKIEIALVESEEKYRLLVENTKEVIFVVQDGRIQFSNAEGIKRSGFSLEDLQRKSYLEFVHPDDRALVADRYRRRLNGEKVPTSYSFRTLDKDGGTAWGYFSVVSIMWKGAPAVLAFGIDITGLKNTEAELQESEQRFRSLFLNSHAVMLIIDPSTGNIEDANPAACAFYGYPRNELLAKKISQINMLPNHEVFQEMQRAKAQQRSYFIFRHRLASGEVRDVEVYSGPVMVGRRELLYSIIHDITDRKRLEEERDRLFNLSLDMLCIAGFDGYFKQVNPAWSRTLGWTEQELLSSPYFDFVHPDDRDATVRASRRLIDGSPILGFENRYRSRDGTYRWISWNSFPLQEEQLMFGVARDITMRKDADRRLEESEELFRTTFEQAAVGVCHVDPEGRFLRVNKVLCDIWGYSREELRGLTHQQITHPDDLRSDLEQVARIRSGDLETYFQDKRYLRADGSAVWCHLTLSLVRDASGEPKYFIGVIEDITRRKHLENELKRLATRDSLTGAFNRQHFLQRAEEEFERARRYKHPLSVMMLDVDHFKLINDTHGHHAGDVVLKALVEQCRVTLRTPDLFGRLGGEEFGAILTETEANSALGVAERLRIRLAALSLQPADQPIALTVSIGLTSCQEEDRTIEEAIRRADMALYEAKKRGRNCVVLRRGDESKAASPGDKEPPGT